MPGSSSARFDDRDRDSGIRSFQSRDIDRVADLYFEAYGMGTGPSPASLRAYFEKIYFGNPWADPELPSWVHEAPDGTIDGFRGILPRPMLFQGRPITAAVASTIMVARAARGRGIGQRLLQRTLATPAQLLFTDGANQAARRLWLAAGGELCLVYGCTWTKLLRPVAHVLSLAGAHKRIRLLARALRPIARLPDVLLQRAPVGPFRRVRPRHRGADMTTDTLAECLISTHGSRSLTPVYDAASVAWLIDDARAAVRRGALTQIVVRDGAGRLLGWYVYYRRRDAINTVLHLGAAENGISAVLEDLFERSRQDDAVAVSGRFEPRFAAELADQQCSFSFSNLGMLIYCKDEAIRGAVHRGDTTLSRLDGEWWMHFADGPWSNGDA